MSLYHGKWVPSVNFLFNHGPDAFVFVDFMRPSLVEYRQAQSAGHYMLRVSGARVEIDFYAWDSLVPTETYRPFDLVLRLRRKGRFYILLPHLPWG